LGSPLGLQFSVTAGVISATGRTIGILDAAAEGEGSVAPLEHFIQTDAAINPGNSGGPLVNLAGEVVGINTAIASTTGFFAGYGFAVPINLAQRVAEQLIANGKVTRAFLGVVLSEVSATDAEVYGLPAPEGAAVIHVQEGGPAATAGIQLGDVITAVNDRAVETRSDLQAALATFDPNESAVLRIVRYGESLEVPIELGTVTSGVTPQVPPGGDGPLRVGFAVREDAGRVIVTHVRPYSGAMHAGVRPGQVILSVNRRPVTSVREFNAGVQAARNGIVSLTLIDPSLGETIMNFEMRR
jgi:serine protease Do